MCRPESCWPSWTTECPTTGTGNRRRAPPGDSSLPLEAFLKLAIRLIAGDSASVRGVRSRFSDLGPRNLRAIVTTALAKAISLGDARRAVQQLLARRRPGRSAGRGACRACARTQPGTPARSGERHGPPGRVAAGHPRPSSAARAGRALRRRRYASAEAAVRDLQRRSESRAGDGPAARAVELADACVISQWRLHGTTPPVSAGHRTAPGGLPHSRPRRTSVAAGSLACRSYSRPGWLSRSCSRVRVEAVARLDSLAFTAGPSGDAIMYAPCSSPVCTSTLAILSRTRSSPPARGPCRMAPLPGHRLEGGRSLRDGRRRT